MPLRIVLAGVPAAVAFAVSDASFAAAAAAFGLGCLLFCAPSATAQAVTALAAAFVTLTLWVFLAAAADALAALSDFDLRSSAETFGRRVDAALLAGCLLVFLRTPDGARLARVGASAAGTFFVSAARTVASAPRVTADAAPLLLRRVPTGALLALATAAGVTAAYVVRAGFWSPEPAVVVLLCAASGLALFAAFRVVGMRLAEGWPGGPRQEPHRDREDRDGRHGAEHRPFAAALVTLGLAVVYSTEVLADFDPRAAAAFGLVFLLLCGPSPPLLAVVTLAGALVTLTFAVSDVPLADAFADFDARTVAAFGPVFLLLCAPSLTPLAVIALAAALVTLTLLVFGAVGAPFGFDWRSFAETFGRPVDAVLLFGCLLLFLRTPAAALLAPVTASAAGTRREGRYGACADHRLKLTFAGALVALALAATHVSSADAFSDFDTTTIAAFGVTVNAALVLLLLFRTVAAALLVLITAAGGFFTLALAVTHAFSAGAFSAEAARPVAAALGVTVNAALLSGASLLLCRIPANALLALITAAGVTTAYGVFTDLWATEPAAVLLLGATSGFALFVAFGVIDDRPRAGAGLAAAALAALAAVVVGHWEPRVESAPVSGDVSNIRNVSLSRTPNLYFISFDSLVPRALLKKHLDVDDTGFHALFDAKFRRFPNLFVNAVSTQNSLYTVLALDPLVANSQMEAVRNPGTFAGRNPSPLLGILRENGYETSTLFQDTYLGSRKGPWVDNYVHFENHTLCNLLDEAIHPWAFWGYCRWFRREDPVLPRFLERITSVDAAGEPQFTMAHLYAPGHVGPSYRHGSEADLERFRTQYLRGIESAADSLDLIVRHVEREDPGAILLVYGDHGMYVSEGVEFDGDPEFFVQDRYGVLGGVFPPDACAPWFDRAAAPGWMTLLDAVHAVLSCLSSDGKGALVEPRTYVINTVGFPAIRPPSGYLLRRQARYADFDDFLYE